MKKTLVNLLTVIFLFFVLSSSFSCSKAYIDEDFFSSWMKYLKDDCLLTTAVIPGSHDAGTNGLQLNMDTQSSTIKEQLEAGTRYFDLRVKYNYKHELAIFHGVQTGMVFESVLDDLSGFITANPTEFLILDFQHFEEGGGETLEQVQIDVEERISERLNPQENALKKGVDLKTLTIGNIRESGAKYIVTWGRDEETVLSKDYIFKREDYLCSPYNKPEHQDDWNRLMNYFRNYYAENDSTRLFVLQSQPTSGDLRLFNDTYIDDMNAFVDSLCDSEYLNKTNIIMRDFIVHNPETVRCILRLNLVKGTIKEDGIKMFQLNTQK